MPTSVALVILLENTSDLFQVLDDVAISPFCHHLELVSWLEIEVFEMVDYDTVTRLLQEVDSFRGGR